MYLLEDLLISGIFFLCVAEVEKSVFVTFSVFVALAAQIPNLIFLLAACDVANEAWEGHMRSAVFCDEPCGPLSFYKEIWPSETTGPSKQCSILI